MAFLRKGWPPLKFSRMCRECRHEVKWRNFHRALFLICCLAAVAAICGAGVGIVYLILWLTGTPTSTL